MKKAGSQKKRVEDALRDVLLGVYYRHEFARQNPDVVKASNIVFNEFAEAQKVRSQNSNFIIQAKPLKTITDLLIKGIGKDSKSARRKQVLVDFLRDYKVIPVPAPDLLFLPLPLIVKSERRKIEIKEQPAGGGVLYDCWEKFQEFETSANMIGLREPIFMPFTVLPKTRELAEPFLNHFFRDAKPLPEKYHKAFLIDCNQPTEDIVNHLTVWLDYYDANKTSDIKNIHEKNAKKELLGERTPWGELHEYLLAVDYYRTHHKTNGDERRVAVDFVREYFPEEYKTSKDRNYAQTRFIRWLNAGNDWVKNYKTII